MHQLRRKLRVFAGGIILALAWGASMLGLPDNYLPLLRVLPEMLALLIVILAWRYRRGRLALVALMIALVNLLFRSPSIAGAVLIEEPAWTLLSRLLLLNLATLALLPDRPLFHRSTLVQAFVLFLQGLAILRFLPSLALFLADRFPASWALLQTRQTLDLLFLLVLLCVLTAALLRRGSFEVAMLWVTGTFYLLLRFSTGPASSSLYFTAGEILLLLSLVEDSYRLAYVDPLTGLEGRRALDEELKSLNGKFSLAMIDIDHFKKFNDRWGHDSGDQALRMIAQRLAGVGGGGRAYRYGGEEFTIVFDGMEATKSVEFLENLRETIASSPFGIRGPGRPKKEPASRTRPPASLRKIKITVSMGLADSSADRSSAQAVLKAADTALYRAKKAGRNRLKLSR